MAFFTNARKCLLKCYVQGFPFFTRVSPLVTGRLPCRSGRSFCEPPSAARSCPEARWRAEPSFHPEKQKAKNLLVSHTRRGWQKMGGCFLVRERRTKEKTRTLRIKYNKSSVCNLPRLADTSMARCACTQRKRVDVCQFIITVLSSPRSVTMDACVSQKQGIALTKLVM